MSKDDKQRVLATNRLLEILRAERGPDDSEESEPSSRESAAITEENEEDLQYLSRKESGEINEPAEPSQSDFSSLFTDKQPDLVSDSTTEEETEPVQSTKVDENIEDSEIFTDEPPKSEKQKTEQENTKFDIEDKKETDSEVAKLAAALSSETGKSEKESDYSEELKDDLLLKTELPKDFTKLSSTEEVLPPEFNDTLITYLEEEPEIPKWKKRFKYLKHFFLDNRRKLTFYIDGNTIYYLQTLAGLNHTKIEKAKFYSVPYEYGTHVLTGINDLFAHILENEVDEKDKRSSFCAYFSMNTPSKTITIKSPKLKPNELKELVEWNANKNLPFSTENKNVNYKILKSGLEGETQDVIIGVTETDSVNTIDNIFNRNNLKLIYTSTLPILLWKSFVKNYPDRDVGSYVIVHIGEARTLVIVVTDHVLQFSRKIALGAQDFYKAVQKKVEKDESGTPLDNSTIKDVLRCYGYSQNLSGITYGSNIDINKLTIAIRPVVERIVSELSRTLNYFKNQKSDLEWKQLLFDGVAASFPGLLESIQESIFQKVELLNPMRTGEYVFGDNAEINLFEYPNYVMNFALAADELEDFNVATKNIRQNYKYSYMSKITAAILAMMIPLFLFSGLYSSLSLKRGQKTITAKQNELKQLAIDTQDFASFMGDIKIVNSFNHFLKNDRTYSENQIRMLQLFSSIVPEEIKLTSLNFVNASGLPDSVVIDENFREHLEVSGFVNENKSVADIYLTDFILKLEKMKYFTDVITLEKTDNDFSNNSELFFKLRLDLK